MSHYTNLSFWAAAPDRVRFVCLLVLLMNVVASIQAVWIALRLYRAKSTAFDETAGGGMGADTIAAHAIATRLPSVKILTRLSQRTPSANLESRLEQLGIAEIETAYLFDEVSIALAFVTEQSEVAVVVSVAATVWGAIPTLGWNYNDANIPWSAALIQSFDVLSFALGLGLAYYAVLKLALSILRRRLESGRAAWNRCFGSESTRGSIV